MLIPARMQMSTQQEDALVDRISALLTNHLLTHANDNQTNFESHSPLSPIDTTNFDQLLQRIRNEVDHNLIHQSLESPNNLPHKHSRRAIEPPIFEASTESLRAKSILKRRRMHLQFKSQSVDSASTGTDIYQSKSH